MDPRYQHPQVTELWSPAWTYDAWWRIETETLRAQRRSWLDGQNAEMAGSAKLLTWLEGCHVQGEAAGEIQAIERRTHHDVAAFLEWLRLGSPGDSGRWIHYGLTSSDLVDTAQALRFRALEGTLHSAMSELYESLAWYIDVQTPVLGRTHGQPAEPMPLMARATHWWELIWYAHADLRLATERMQRMKLSGPVGQFAHNTPEVEAAVAAALKLEPQGAGSSQIVPRVHLSHWADAAARLAAACAKVAMDVRLMLLLGEVKEKRPEGQVGSSSMAHKTNPIRAEQITGMQRLAAGYASMLRPLDLWLERDISNSSVERVAVPDLWHTTFHVIHQTTRLLRSLDFGQLPLDALAKAKHLPFVHTATLEGIQDGLTVEQARHRAQMAPARHSMQDYTWFGRNYPGTKDEES